MHRMKELYAVQGRHSRYALMKSFFSAKVVEGSSVREHGVVMVSLVEKLKDLQANFEKEETYVDLINMLVQYEATLEKSAPSVLVGEASTSKAKGKVAGLERGRRMRHLVAQKNFVLQIFMKATPPDPKPPTKEEQSCGEFTRCKKCYQGMG
ncbi:UNVERIFIED_CONTAM: hypothetical protein Sradi_3588200 [Sesamum radiatum]|uniref:Uncharacterized protein n=1 Tax=Sesamum radiatum TaxID=300843 RepID=A0AAW2QGI0_SESRA